MSDFQYGLVARSLYVALCWLTVLVGFVAPNLLPWHVGLLVFLGLGLKPLLLKTGLRDRWLHFLVRIEETRYAESDAKNARRIERERRDNRLRKARRLSDELPRNW